MKTFYERQLKQLCEQDIFALRNIQTMTLIQKLLFLLATYYHRLGYLLAIDLHLKHEHWTHSMAVNEQSG